MTFDFKVIGIGMVIIQVRSDGYDHYDLTIINKHYYLMTSSDPVLVPIRSAVKSNLTAWCSTPLKSTVLAKLIDRVIKALTVQTSITELVITHCHLSIQIPVKRVV